MERKGKWHKAENYTFHCVHFKLPHTYTEMANHCLCQDEETNKRSSNKIIISPSGSISLLLATFFLFFCLLWNFLKLNCLIFSGLFVLNKIFVFSKFKKNLKFGK
jgi:hypothetical protein